MYFPDVASLTVSQLRAAWKIACRELGRTTAQVVACEDPDHGLDPIDRVDRLLYRVNGIGLVWERTGRKTLDGFGRRVSEQVANTSAGDAIVARILEEARRA